MSVGYGPLTIAVGMPFSESVGTRSTCSQLVVYNESQNLLLITAGHYNNYAIPAWTGDKLDFSTDNAFSGNITAVVVDISNLSNPPSSVVLLNAYSPGEPVPGTYPLALVRQVNGTLTNQTLTNDNNGRQIVIEMTLAGNVSGTSNVQLWNDGTLLIYGLDAGILTNLLNISPGVAGGHASGFIETNTFTISTTANLELFSTLGPIQMNLLPTLVTGFQFSGVCGVEGVAAGAGNANGNAVTFPIRMTNTPSSITISSFSALNNNAMGVFNITKNGFTIAVSAVAAGHFFEYANYTTVGNTLLAFNQAAMTYDHHCDGCDMVTHGNPTAGLHIITRGADLCIAHVCSVCGCQQCFNPDLPVADLSDAQSVLIHSLCAAVIATDPRAQVGKVGS